MTDKKSIIQNIINSQQSQETEVSENAEASEVVSSSHKDKIISQILDQKEKQSSDQVFAQETKVMKDERRKNLIDLLVPQEKSEDQSENQSEAKGSIQHVSEGSAIPPPSTNNDRRKELVALLSGENLDSDLESKIEKAMEPKENPILNLKYKHGHPLTMHTFMKKLNVYKNKDYNEIKTLIESIFFEFVDESDRKKMTFEVLKTIADTFKKPPAE